MKFSILHLLSVTMALAAVIGLYASRQANARIVDRYEAKLLGLQAEIAQLQASLKSARQEAGFLTIDDPTKIYAVKLRSSIEKVWSYRVHLPQGNSYYFASKINSLPSPGTIPGVGSPPNASTISGLGRNSVAIGRDSGEYLVTLSLRRMNDQWKYELGVRKSGDAGRGATGGGVVTAKEEEWPNNADWIAESGVVNQKEFPVGPSCLLLDFRAMDVSIKSSQDSNQGALIWVGVAD